jgi:hypothetical protein
MWCSTPSAGKLSSGPGACCAAAAFFISIVSPVAAEKAASLGLRGAFFIVEPNRAQLVQMGHLIDKGTLGVVVGAVLPLARAREAFER